MSGLLSIGLLFEWPSVRWPFVRLAFCPLAFCRWPSVHWPFVRLAFCPGAASNKGGVEKSIIIFLALCVEYGTRTDTILLMTNRKLCALSIGTKVDDLGWP